MRKVFSSLFLLCALGLVPSAGIASPPPFFRCVLSYSIDVARLGVGESNLGTAEVRCFRGDVLPVTLEAPFLAFNTATWANTYREQASIEAIGVDLSPESFLNALVRSKPADFQQAPRSVYGYSHAAVLRAPGLYQEEMSVVLQQGMVGGFALQRGFQAWGFSLANGEIVLNPQRTHVRSDCQAVSTNATSVLTDCLGLNQP